MVEFASATPDRVLNGSSAACNIDLREFAAFSAARRAAGRESFWNMNVSLQSDGANNTEGDNGTCRFSSTHVCDPKSELHEITPVSSSQIFQDRSRDNFDDGLGRASHGPDSPAQQR